jgi:hypothetical protein
VNKIKLLLICVMVSGCGSLPARAPQINQNYTGWSVDKVRGILDNVLEQPDFGWCDGWEINPYTGEVIKFTDFWFDLKSCVYVL